MQRTYQFNPIGPTRAHSAIVDLLTAVGRRQSYAKGRTIIRQGDQANGFWLIREGQVTICRFGAQGALTVFAVLGPGDLLGDIACLAGTRRQVDAIAEEDADLIWIDQTQVEALLAGEPKIARWLLASLAAQLSIALNRIETNQSLSAEARLARFLSDLAERDGQTIKVTQQELANFIGVSRVTIGHIIRRMADAGLVKLGYKALTILQPAQLQMLSTPDS